MTTPRTRGRLAVVGLLVLTAAAVLAPSPPAAADGNEIPGAPPAARDLTAGGDHTCAVVARRAVKCWGAGSSGQLGYGDADNRGDGATEMGNDLPTVSFGLGLQAQSLTAGRAHTCVRSLEGHVACWGDNGDGQLGFGDTENRGDDPGEMGSDLPRVDLGQANGPRFAVAVTAGADHTCALLDTRRVTCWGANADGQLGLGHTANRGDGPGEMGTALTLVALGTGRTVAVIAGGAAHTCALLDDGTVKCWGANASGQLGQGDTDHRGDGPGEMGDALDAVDLGTGRTATGITAGGDTSCALLDDGTVKCWGEGGVGQLGSGATDDLGDGPGEMGDSLLAVDLGSGRSARAVTAGADHTCARRDDGSVVCWGAGASGQLGRGDTAQTGDASGEMGDDLVTAELGSTCAGRAVTVDLSLAQVPTEGADVILGTPAADVVDGLGGNDTICGGGGPDRLNGGDDHDHVFGQDGNDILRGSGGNDTLDGAAGQDGAFGGGGIDRLVGGPGLDRLGGGDQDDLFQGGPGADRLYGGNDDDRMNGDAGNDLLDAGAGDDRLNGDAHRDTCHGRRGADTQSGCEVTTGIP